MKDKRNHNKLQSPHDKLFKKIMGDSKNAKSFLQEKLPERIERLIDFETLEIVKDSFIDENLADFHSDLLYKVMLNSVPGFIYVLFEHKSYYDRYIHLQLLEYMLKIWRFFIKQQKKGEIAPLPIIIPLLICHGAKPWPENTERLSSLFDGPTTELSLYIPDFAFELYDLTCFSDKEIKGTIMVRVVQLLFKYVSDPDFKTKLPDILSLMKTLMEKDTGLQYLEIVLRYLFSTMNDISAENIKEIAEQALSKKEGEFTMTLADMLRKEGKIEGLKEGKIEGLNEGKIKGLNDAIELGMILKFPDHTAAVMAKVSKVKSLDTLESIKETIKTAKDVSEILLIIKGVS